MRQFFTIAREESKNIYIVQTKGDYTRMKAKKDKLRSFTLEQIIFVEMGTISGNLLSQNWN